MISSQNPSLPEYPASSLGHGSPSKKYRTFMNSSSERSMTDLKSIGRLNFALPLRSASRLVCSFFWSRLLKSAINFRGLCSFIGGRLRISRRHFKNNSMASSSITSIGIMKGRGKSQFRPKLAAPFQYELA